MLDVDETTAADLWRRVMEIMGALGAGAAVIAPKLDEAELARRVEALDFLVPSDPRAVLEAVVESMGTGQVHATDPRYFGPYTTAPANVAVMASALVAAFNPQLATHGHAAWPVEVETRLLRAFGEKLGHSDVDGTFTHGGAEANATAVLAALHHTFPVVATRGLRVLAGDPQIYVSAEAHPTIARAARLAGLGSGAVRVIPVDARLRMKTPVLREAMARDREAGALPFMIVGTAGTTSAGSIDPLDELASIAERAGCWFHVDAAWGGLAALVPELRRALDGIERADSITFDPHKALSVPLGAGMYLSRRKGVLDTTFHEHAGYMPKDASRDPYARSMQWSRRFLGLPLFVMLATVGWEGYAASLRHQVAMAARLRARLVENRFRIMNDSPLPVVCFDSPTGERRLDPIARAVIAENAGWLSVTRFSHGARALRACIVNHRTTAAHVDGLVEALVRARHTLSTAR